MIKRGTSLCNSLVRAPPIVLNRYSRPQEFRLMKHANLHLSSAIIVVMLAVLCSAPSSSIGQDRAKRRPPVSWVNPELPEAPGLTHRTLDSKAMGHKVGYVVWTPSDYDDSGDTRYPVIYFLHGMGGTESRDAAGFSGLVRRGVRDGQIPPVRKTVESFTSSVSLCRRCS